VANKKVRAGQTFYFVPVMIDAIHKPHNVEPGDFVQVVNLPGCPRANTMGHAHVNVLMRANGVATPGTFGGLVCTNSLVTREEYMAYLTSKIETYITAHEAGA
jgi:hypothetical protein